jgi:tetratricopeptide (TPR) repeat protein
MTSVAPEPLVPEDRRRVLLLAIAVALLAALPFLPALWNGFVSWDDDRNFLRNPFYRGLGIAELRWMWSTYHMGHYIPFSWMTLGLDYVLWGMDARGYHLTNIVLHAANSVVLFFVSRRVLGLALNEPRTSMATALSAAISSLFFAVHPLRVESVAWATERRDMLSGLFYSLTVLVYLRAIERGPLTARRYAPVFILFLCALLSKATAMTLPAVLLLINIYPLRRLSPATWRESARQLARELAPLFMLSAAAAMMSIVALGFRPQFGVIEKLALSSYSVAFYLWKTLVPLSLGPIYPMPLSVPLASAPYLISYAIAAALAFVVLTERRRWPGAATAVAAFLVMVLPMLGVVQNGPQIAADRYTYHAAPALALLVGAAFHLGWKWRARTTAAITALGLTALGALTAVQTTYWRDSYTLWNRAVQVADHSAIAHDGLATALLNRDSLTQALAHYERATVLNPYYADARANIGVVLARLGRFEEAPKHFERALELKPDFDAAENNWGVVLAMQGKLMAAIGHYRLALSINPDNAEAELNWANALVAGGNLDVALPHYARAAALNPAWPDIEARWGATLAQLGKLDEAVPHFERAVKLDPSDQKAAQLLERARSEIAARQPLVIRQ